MRLNYREDIIEWTKLNPYDRFPNGRPRVPDDILQRMKKITIEQAWGVLQGHGYHLQFEGDWMNLHPDRVLVGRAVTAVFMPTRPDLHAVVEEQGKADGCIGAQNSWVIDTLVENDVIVVDVVETMQILIIEHFPGFFFEMTVNHVSIRSDFRFSILSSFVKVFRRHFCQLFWVCKQFKHET